MEIINELVINPGEIINIENAYEYSSVRILGTSNVDTGILRWRDGDIVREYKYSDLLITRDTVMTQADYDAGNYSNVFVLDGYTLTIEQY